MIQFTPMLKNTFDCEPVPAATARDLDLALVFKTIQQGLDLRRLSLADMGITAEAFRAGNEEAALQYLLRHNGAVMYKEPGQDDRFMLTVAGTLAFTRTPDRWVQSSGLDLAHYEADPRPLPNGLFAVPSPTQTRIYPVRGPIFTVIDRTVDILRDACSTTHLDGARIVTRIDTPLSVLRELTANGVIHRDLQLVGELVRVQIFPSAIEWISPGRLPPEKFPEDVPLTLGLLLRVQYSRNPALSMFLFHAGYIEKFGLGLDDVVATLAANGREAPSFHNDTHSFRVRVLRDRVSEVEAPPRDTPEAREQRIMALFAEAATWAPQAIEERLKIPRSTLHRDLRRLIQTGLLRAVGATHSRYYQRISPDS